jgi:hypothetical protein
VVQLEGDTFQVYRTDITIRFKAGVSDSAKRVFFSRHWMTVVGVTQSGQFFARIPDPGPSFQNLADTLQVLRSEPEVFLVTLIPRTPLPTRDSAQDTSRPAVPSLSNLPLDSTFTVEAPDLPRAQGLYYRNIVGIIFDDTTSGATIRRLLSRYRGTIIGGTPGEEYIVRIPGPGPTFAALESIVTQLYAEPGVALARKVYYRTPIYIHGRVIDIGYRVPIQRATVRILGTSFAAETDSGGRFELSFPFLPGCHRLLVRAIGYGWTEVRFVPTADPPTAILGEVPLRPAPLPEWPLLLVSRCDSGPFTKNEAPWGVDTLPPH